MNRVSLVGRITKDPELKSTQSGTSCVHFTVACDMGKSKSGERLTEFVPCTAWSQRAEFISKYVRKGMLLEVEGSVSTYHFTAQDGSTRYVTEVTAQSVRTHGGSSAGQSGASAAPPPDEGFQEVEDDDMPF